MRLVMCAVWMVFGLFPYAHATLNLHVGDDLSGWIPKKTKTGLWAILKSQDKKGFDLMDELYENMEPEYKPSIGITLHLCGTTANFQSLKSKHPDWILVSDPTCSITKRVGILVFPTFIVHSNMRVVRIHSSLLLLTLRRIEEDLSTALEVVSVRKLAIYTPDSPERRRARAESLLQEAKKVLLQKTNDNQGRELLHKALEIFPNCYSCNLLLGALDFAQGNMIQARAQFQKALDLSPNNPQAFLGLGLALLSEERFSSALHILLASKKLGGHRAWVDYGLTQACRHLPHHAACEVYKNFAYKKPGSYQGLWP